jgi:tRNA U34 5-methylaminomethyl-2-thiouridine-forming methyltransferase MnmC
MRKNEAKQSEMKRKFCLFVSQTEAKIMRNGLRFASISHEAKKKFTRKRDTLAASILYSVQYSNIVK